MTFEDIIKEYRDAKARHLTEEELDAYYYDKLNVIIRARADAHLKDCLKCKKQLEDMIEESAVLTDRERTAKDQAIIDWAMQQTGFQQETADTKPEKPVTGIPLPERLVEYLRQVVADWRAYFKQLEAIRGAHDTGDEVWKWQSEDGALKVRAVLGADNALTIQFVSNELVWEGVQLIVRLGPIEHEATWKRLSEAEAEVYAEIRVPRHDLPQKPSDISIKIG
ncbi:MAG: hypothetical protein WBV94_03290 [Blastocatellia bacterium]